MRLIVVPLVLAFINVYQCLSQSTISLDDSQKLNKLIPVDSFIKNRMPRVLDYYAVDIDEFFLNFNNKKTDKKLIRSFEDTEGKLRSARLKNSQDSALEINLSLQSNLTNGGTNSERASVGQIIALPSPTAASLVSGITDDVDLYTGRLNVSLPLFNLVSRSLSVPVTLNYTSQGIRVNDIASWVGLGMSLQCGGIISRVMKGLPDEYIGKVNPKGIKFDAFGYLNTLSKVNLSNFANMTISQKRKLAKFSYWQILDGMNYGDGFPEAWDTQPDEFYFNFGKYSGKFVFNQDGTIHTIPYQNLKISKTIINNESTGNIPKITQFEVITEDGTIYVFGDNSLQSVEESKLEILSLQNNYQYVCLGYYTSQNLLVYVYFRVPLLAVTQLSNGILVNDDFRVPDNASLSTFNFFTSAWYLKEIRSPNNDDFITFNYESNGEITYIQDKTLSVTMPNLSEGYISSGNEGAWFFQSQTFPDPVPGTNLYIHPVKGTFTFSMSELTVKSKRLQSIITSTNNSALFVANTPKNDIPGDRRLDEIAVYENNDLIRRYVFDYEEITAPSLSGNVYLLANGVIMDTDAHSVSRKYQILNSWGQAIDLNLMVEKYGKIFLGESKRLFLKSVTEYGRSGYLPPYKFEYDPGVYELPRRFSYHQDKWGFYNPNNNRGTLMPVISYIGKLFNTTVSGDIRPLIGWSHAFSTEPSWKGAIQSPNFIKSQAGILKKVYTPLGSLIEYYYSLNTNTTNSSIGGLRVSQIKEYPDYNEPSNYRLYQYSYLNGNEAGTQFYQYTLPTFNNSLAIYESTVFASESSVTPPLLTKGGVAGYRQVSLIRPGIGRTEYVFKTNMQEENGQPQVFQFDAVNQFPLASSQYPFPKLVDRDWRRGLLESKTDFNENGQILSKVINVYKTRPENFPMVKIRNLIGGMFFWNGEQIYRVGITDYESDWVFHESTITEIYDQSDPGNEGKKLVTSVQYQYVKPGELNIQLDLMPRKIIEILPNGDKIISEIKYPLDYSISSMPSDPATKGIYLLNEKRMNNIPIEAIRYFERQENMTITKYFIDGTLSRFKEFLPGKVYAWDTYKLKAGAATEFTIFNWSSVDANNVFRFNTSIYKLLSTALEYNVFGKLLKGQGENGINYSYNWGYNSSLLTSVIENPGAYQHEKKYQHKPMVGITQVTDPNLRDIKYTYDNFNRLKLIRDHDDQILNRYLYHYQGGDDNAASFAYELYGETTFRFIVTSHNAPGSTYIWDFGNGVKRENGQLVEFVSYNQPGQYIVTLTVTHPEFPPSVARKTIKILEPFTVQIITPVTGTNRTVSCGNNATTVCEASVDNSDLTYQWQYLYSASGNSNYINIGTNSKTLTFSLIGANGSSYSIRCRITDNQGNSRYSSNTIQIWYTCGSGGGSGNCPEGWMWNAQLGRCEPPEGYCGEGCFWSGIECICQ
ncbi:MAG: hypothetical protein N2044_05620 [Cyclobacteriaceae bacterium]|nr:hypothetical protein [Cyclobacteriaceae bacterium]MCX7637311.1 hypothetical protein [Cyclobacteriaceae bacterium]MDW8331110.1 hypothetical protein [Cyclobacteriaceae bacterium]